METIVRKHIGQIWRKIWWCDSWVGKGVVFFCVVIFNTNCFIHIVLKADA